MARFEYAQAAITDVDNILTYTTKKWGSKQAENYLNTLEKQAQLLADMPTIGKHYKPYKDKGYRAFPYEKHLIYYVERSFGITLMHIVHESMNQVQY